MPGPEEKRESGYLAHTDLEQITKAKVGQKVEVTTQRTGDNNRRTPNYIATVTEINPTQQKNNPSVTVVTSSGEKRVVGSGTAIKKTSGK